MSDFTAAREIRSGLEYAGSAIGKGIEKGLSKIALAIALNSAQLTDYGIRDIQTILKATKEDL